MDHSHCHSKKEISFKIGKKLKIFGSLFLVIFLISFLPFFSKLNQSLIEYMNLIWWAVLLGLFIGGVIDYFVPEKFIFKYLGQQKKRTLFYSAFAGFVLSACSHGILAIAMQLYKKGASVPAVITFLLASPWANLPMTFLMFGIFGWKAALIIGAAIVIALTTGFIYLILDKLNFIESSVTIENQDTEYSWDKIRDFDFSKSVKGVMSGSVNLANMVLWWIMIGFVIAAILRAYVPGHFFMEYLGPDIWGLLLTLFFATIIEVCSEGSSPLAFEIYSKVGTLGNPFVFLMAGVVTDYTEIGLIWSNIGKRSAILLPIITVPQVLLMGYLFNNLF